MDEIVNDLVGLSDAEFREKCAIHAVKVGPINRATRKLYAKKVAKKMLEGKGVPEESKSENSKEEEQKAAPLKVNETRSNDSMNVMTNI